MSGFNAVLARNTKNAPENPGLSSQTVAFSHYNNFSAQLPIDPATGALVAGDVKAQARQCFRNIEAVLSSIGHQMSDVVRLSVFVRNILDADLVDDVFAEYFQAYVPARTTAAVASLPMDALVQIEVLISNGEGTIPNAPQAGDLIKLVNNTANAPVSALSSQTVSFSHYNNLTAQLPVDPRTGRVIDADAAAQAAQCLRNIKAILESIDVPLDDIVKINLYLTDLADLAAVRHTLSLLLSGLKSEKRLARESIYLVLNQFTDRSGFTPRSFQEELSKTLGWAPPLAAIVPYDPGVPQAQDDGTPPVTRGDEFAKGIRAIVNTLFPSVGNTISSSNEHKSVLRLPKIRFT